ncbi:1-acylglycerol-3-phosphate O-acyltransferase [Actinobacillus vicugnae]|uniref:1-acylglycerol-3-phosphate O-acyltransferase n=1 Tax=Actinobacillus vicugnae TaxID=2573093 RepID=UPI00124084A5|nr:1-acylglycerol-3-phosphate O-acyltransferase [Actinobacillus vicugnae]
MLKIARIIVIAITAIFISIIGTLYAFIRFRHPSSVSVVAKMYASMQHLVGLNVIYRPLPEFTQSAIYIANHQNNYDMLTIAGMVPPRTVTIGKKSLIWVPFFGLVYWATGNIFINREKRSSAISTMNKVGEIIRERQISIWMFPEGTRSRGRGLLPFKTGAFHTAIAAGVPIVPIVCSSLHNKVDLNRWNNGTVICETLEPIDTSSYNRDNIKELIEKCHSIMATKIADLDAEIAVLDAKK